MGFDLNAWSLKLTGTRAQISVISQDKEPRCGVIVVQAHTLGLASQRDAYSHLASLQEEQQCLQAMRQQHSLFATRTPNIGRIAALFFSK